MRFFQADSSQAKFIFVFPLLDFSMYVLVLSVSCNSFGLYKGPDQVDCAN